MTGRSSDDWVAPPVYGAGEASGEPPILVFLAPDLASKAADVADDAGFLLGHAANIFGLLREGIAGGSISASDAGVRSLCKVCERAFRDMSWKEGEVLDRVGVAIRKGLRMSLEERRTSDLRRQAEEARHAAQP